jgi:hypothetical protein
MLRHNITRSLFLPAAALLCGVSGAPIAAQQSPGLWLLPRKDAQNTARTDVPGNWKTAPHEVWAYGGVTDSYAFLRPVVLGGKTVYLGLVRSGLRLMRTDGHILWNHPAQGIASVVSLLDFGGPHCLAALVTTRDAFSLFDIATGKPLWHWSLPLNTHLMGYKVLQEKQRARLFCFPQDSVSAYCFEFRTDTTQPRLLWKNDYPNTFWQNYGPSLILADMDNDGKPDIVIAGKPGYIGVIDTDTGKMKFDIHYDVPGADHFGRPYGLLAVGDMDGDGYNDVVMVSCQVEKYIAVIHNERGKGLRLAWSQFVEREFPDDFREIRPNVTSLAGLHGDGKKSLVLGLYNMDGDQRWHTIVFDGMKGFHERLADLPGRYFWGCYDLDGSGHPQIVTSNETAQHSFSNATTVQAVDGVTFRDVATVDRAALSQATLALPVNTEFMAERFTPLYLTTPSGVNGLALRRGPSAPEELWHLAGGKSALTPLPFTSLARAVLFSEGSGKIGRFDIAFKNVPRVTMPAAFGPLVATADGKRELILSLSDGTILGGVPDLSHPGRFQSSWRVPGTTPSLWIGPQGQRIVCAVAPQSDRIWLYQPRLGSTTTSPLTTITLPWPLYGTTWTRSARTLLPFGLQNLHLFVSVQRGTHSYTGILYDAQGKELWRDAEDGPYPRSAAVADLDGQRVIISDDHGKQSFYDNAGKSRLIAEGWTNVVPGRADGSKYALPIVGPFGPGGSTRIVMSPGLDALEILGPSGARLAKRDYAEHYEFEWCGATVAQLRGPGVWDVGMANNLGIFHCADAVTGQDRWTLDLGVTAAYPINAVSGDLDGSGHDSFLVGLPDGRLLALGERNGKGVVLWKVQFPAAVRDTILADVDGDGRAEILVETDDGQVHLLK